MFHSRSISSLGLDRNYDTQFPVAESTTWRFLNALHEAAFTNCDRPNLQKKKNTKGGITLQGRRVTSIVPT